MSSTALPDVLQTAVNAAFLIFAGSLVFWMKAGFALLEAGSVTKASVLSIVLKNNVDLAIGIIFYYAVGWAWAFGPSGNGFIGNGQYFLKDFATVGSTTAASYPLWFFQFSFCAAAITIVSGAVAERVHFQGFMLFAAVGYAWIQPVVAHWIWSTDGWMSVFNPNLLFGVGVLDFAGGGVVHMVGGVSALAALFFVGYRNKYVEPAQRERARHPERLLPRFEQDMSGKWKENPLPGSSGLMVALGTFILFFGWLGFNGGSIIDLVGTSTINGVTVTISRGNAAGRTIICTLMSAGTGMLTAMVVGRLQSRKELFYKWSLGEVCNGLLSGLVCVTPAAGYVEVWAAMVFGVFGALAYKGVSAIMSSPRVRLDDPVDAVAIHAGAGACGLFLTGCFAVPEYVQEIGTASAQGGAFYVSSGGTGMRLGAQLLAIVVIFFWTFVFAFIIWGLMYLFDRNRTSDAWFLVRAPFSGQVALKATDRDEELQRAFQPSAFAFADDSVDEDSKSTAPSAPKPVQNSESIETQFNRDVALPEEDDDMEMESVKVPIEM